jgi:hypothetical protein
MGGKNKNNAQASCQHMAALGNGAVPGGKKASAPCKQHWVGVRVKDEDGNAVKNIRISVSLTDGSDFTMNLASQALEPDGTWRTKVVLPPGNCEFGFPDVQDVEWWPDGESAPAMPADEDEKVDPGECAASIAADYGFRNYHSFWDDSKNDTLRQSRKNPNQLLRRDVVHLTDRKKRTVEKATDRIWVFVVKKPRPVKLRLVIFDRDGNPVNGCDWQMSSPVVKVGKTGNDGLIQLDDFPVKETWGRLKTSLPAVPTVGALPVVAPGGLMIYPPPVVHTEFHDPDTPEPPERNISEWELKIGNLEPFDTVDGVRSRLGNIGFRCDAYSNDEDTARMVTAYQLWYQNQQNGSGKFQDIQADLHGRHDNP